MATIHRLTTALILLLTLAIPHTESAQSPDKDDAYDEEMRKGDMLAMRRQFELALQAYKKAYALKDKTSMEALFGMVVSYRGLGANKNILDLIPEATKLAGDDPKRQAGVQNAKGAALVAMADKPNDKRLEEAVQAFRAAIAANPELHSAQMNIGVTLLKMGHDADGIEELKKYVASAPKGPDLERAEKMIDEPRRARENFAPDFSLTTKQGEFISLADLKGKTVLLDFWGTWCKPCLMATPGLVRLHKKYAEEGLVILGIAVNDQEDAWAAYIDKNKMEWPQFFDRQRKVVMPFAVSTYPTYIVIDPEGIIRARKSGYGMDTDGWIESEVKRALKKK